MAGKRTGRGKDGESSPLRTERLKSLAVSVADRKRPTAKSADGISTATLEWV